MYLEVREEWVNGSISSSTYMNKTNIGGKWWECHHGTHCALLTVCCPLISSYLISLFPITYGFYLILLGYGPCRCLEADRNPQTYTSHKPLFIISALMSPSLPFLASPVSSNDG